MVVGTASAPTRWRRRGKRCAPCGATGFRLVAGHDLGLRAGNASSVLTADLASADDYRGDDADDEHHRIRGELLAPISSSVHRIRFARPEGVGDQPAM